MGPSPHCHPPRSKLQWGLIYMQEGIWNRGQSQPILRRPFPPCPPPITRMCRPLIRRIPYSLILRTQAPLLVHVLGGTHLPRAAPLSVAVPRGYELTLRRLTDSVSQGRKQFYASGAVATGPCRGRMWCGIYCRTTCASKSAAPPAESISVVVMSKPCTLRSFVPQEDDLVSFA